MLKNACHLRFLNLEFDWPNETGLRIVLQSSLNLFTEITVLLFREIFAAFGTARKFVKISETLFYTFCFLYFSIQEYLTIYTVIWHLAKSKIYENFNALDRTRSSVFSIVCVN